MTEIGRSSGVRLAGAIAFGGYSDALLDATAKSLRSGIAARASKVSIYLLDLKPRKRDLDCLCMQIFSTDFLGCGRAGIALRVGA